MFSNFSNFFVTFLTLYMQRQKSIRNLSYCCDSTENYLQNESKDIKNSDYFERYLNFF